jgi:uncharacterized protein YeaC (DUF1315 family)
VTIAYDQRGVEIGRWPAGQPLTWEQEDVYRQASLVVQVGGKEKIHKYRYGPNNVSRHEALNRLRMPT